MSNIKNYIFNRKILDRLLEKVAPEDLKIFSKFKDNLKGYSDRIRSGKIYKFSELEFQETFLTEIFEGVSLATIRITGWRQLKIPDFGNLCYYIQIIKQREVWIW